MLIGVAHFNSVIKKIDYAEKAVELNYRNADRAIKKAEGALEYFQQAMIAHYWGNCVTCNIIFFGLIACIIPPLIPVGAVLGFFYGMCRFKENYHFDWDEQVSEAEKRIAIIKENRRNGLV